MAPAAMAALNLEIFNAKRYNEDYFTMLIMRVIIEMVNLRASAVRPLWSE